MKRFVAIAAALAASTVIVPTGLHASGDDHSLAEDVGADEDARKAAALAEALAAGEIWLDQYRQYERIPALSAAIVTKRFI